MKNLEQLFNLNEDVFDTEIKYNDLPDHRIGDSFSIFSNSFIIKDLDYSTRAITISNRSSEIDKSGQPYERIDIKNMAPFKKIYNEFGCKKIIIDVDKFPKKIESVMRIKNNIINMKTNGLVLEFPQYGQFLIQSNKNVYISNLKIIADESEKWNNTLTIYGNNITLDNCDFRFDNLHIDCENLVLNNSQIKITSQERCSIKFGPIGEGVRNTKKLAQCILDNQWDGITYDFMNINCKLLTIHAKIQELIGVELLDEVEIVLKKSNYSGNMQYKPVSGSSIIKCGKWEVYFTKIPIGVLIKYNTLYKEQY